MKQMKLQRKYRIGTVSNNYCGWVGGINPFKDQNIPERCKSQAVHLKIHIIFRNKQFSPSPRKPGQRKMRSPFKSLQPIIGEQFPCISSLDVSLMQTDYRLILCKKISFKNGRESPLLVCFVYILTTAVSERKQCKILLSRITNMQVNF